jgi:serine/threonine protein kinase
MRNEDGNGSTAEDLCRQACAELQQRLRAGETCQAETILSAYPLLASDANLAVEVILVEFQVRRELGETLNPLDWLSRFSRYRDCLKHAFADRLLLSEVASDVTTAMCADTCPVVDLDEPMPNLGLHERYEELGHGAMGRVYRARDKVLNRDVALKMIKSGVLAGPDEVRRFYREARAAASLNHPHIVPIHGMGLHEGLHSFTMRLLTSSLERRLGDYTRDFRTAATLMEKVARAVHAAHRAGIIHRDLKPANILLDENGEPLVGDFGLAKFADARADATLPGQVMGTPAYMSPEQASGRTWEITERSDVWSLGVILYELLAGQRPFPGSKAEEVSKRVLSAEPTPPRRLRKEIPRDLETIVLKCLEKNADQRYPSAEALADDLRRWLNGEPVPRTPWIRRIGAKARRHPWRILTVLLLPLVLLVGLSIRARKPDPDAEALAAIYRLLDDGHAYEWSADSGALFRHAWPFHKGALEATPADHSFSVSAFEPVFLEFLPDPRQDRFRLLLEVRHLHSDEKADGVVGAYFGHHVEQHPDGTEHSAVLFDFAASGAAPRWIAAECYHQSERKPIDVATSRLFSPDLPQPWDGYHVLEITVTPERIIFVHNGVEHSSIPTKELEESAAKAGFPRKITDKTASVPTRGGVGLYLRNGVASVRRFQLTPLPPP